MDKNSKEFKELKAKWEKIGWKQLADQLTEDNFEPNPRAIHPMYCRGYCIGYYCAIEHIKKRLGDKHSPYYKKEK